MTEKQFRKRMKQTAEDCIGDGMELDQVAYDVAECLLFDPDISKYLAKNYPGLKTKWTKQTFIAESNHL